MWELFYTQREFISHNLESSTARETTAQALKQRTIRPTTSDEVVAKGLGCEDLDSVNWSSSDSILARKGKVEVEQGGFLHFSLPDSCDRA